MIIYHRYALFSFLFFCFSCQSLDWKITQKENERSEKLKQTRLALVQNQLDLGSPEKALGLVRPLLKTYPGDKDILISAGLTYLALGNNKQALKLLGKAYEVSSTTDVAVNYSSILILEGFYKKAREIVQKHLKDDDYTFKERLLHNLAFSYEKDHQFELAERYYKEALQELPMFYLSTYRLGHLYKNQNKYKHSEVFLKKAYEICQLCYEPVADLVAVYLVQKKPVKASIILRKYLHEAKLDEVDKSKAKKLLSLVATMESQPTIKRE